MTPGPPILEVELATFEERKEELLRYYEGQYVVLHGTEMLGAFTTEAQAYEAALRKVGNVPMLIRQVRPGPEIVHSVPILHWV